MAAKKEEKNVCAHGSCLKCMSIKLLLIGILVILNTVFGWLNWGYFVGGLFILVGLLKLLMPHCPHCN